MVSRLTSRERVYSQRVGSTEGRKKSATREREEADETPWEIKVFMREEKT